MKYFSILAFALFSIAASAQQNNGTTSPGENQERLQQEPPRPQQVNTERAVTRDQRTQNNANRSDMNSNNTTDVQQVLKNEVEQSTGKESENPAVTSPRTVRPTRLSDPVSQPIQNRK